MTLRLLYGSPRKCRTVEWPQPPAVGDHVHVPTDDGSPLSETYRVGRVTWCPRMEQSQTPGGHYYTLAPGVIVDVELEAP